MTTPAPARPTDDGSRLLDGRYRLDAIVGHGGYARVYRALDETLGRTVAIKLFTVDTPDARDLRRRESETRLLAGLTHASLVTLFDARLEGDPAYLVMEFIDGPTLREVIAEKPMDAAAAAGLATELGEALQVIHAAGVVHRDIKPSNVLMRPGLTAGGLARATLADFGIASLVDSTRLTATGSLVGTAAYLSPEQALGDRAGAPSDVYSLGLLLLEALTAQRVFAQSTPHEALAARIARPPAIPPHLPEGWRALLSAMTALEPHYRPDAAAVTRAAERLRHGTASVTAVLPTREPATAATLAFDTTAALDATAALEATAPLQPTVALDAPSSPAPSAAPASPPSPEGESPSSDRRRAPTWLRWAIVIVVLGIVAAVIAFALLSGAPGASTPAPTPSFPPLPEPLGSTFTDLWSTL